MDLDSENSDESEQETDRKGYIREVETVHVLPFKRSPELAGCEWVPDLYLWFRASGKPFFGVRFSKKYSLFQN